MRKFFVCAASLVGLAISGSAWAADMPVKAVPVAAVYDWTGWYAGVNFGGVFGQTDPNLIIDDSLGRYFTFGVSQAANTSTVSAVGSSRFTNSGFTGGGQIGALWQRGTFVWGLEADFEYFNPKGSRTATGFYPAAGALTCANSGAGCAFTINQASSGSWLTTWRLRAGVARDKLLIYGTVGAALAELKYSSSFADTTTAPPQVSAGLVSNFSSSQVRLGYALGAGLEYAFAPRWTVRAEYMFLDFEHAVHNGSTVARPTAGTIPAVGTCPPGGGANGFCSVFNNDMRLFEHVARVAINYKFDWAGAGVVAKY
jgi:outer membrane immunogenic protein